MHCKILCVALQHIPLHCSLLPLRCNMGMAPMEAHGAYGKQWGPRAPWRPRGAMGLAGTPWVHGPSRQRCPRSQLQSHGINLKLIDGAFKATFKGMAMVFPYGNTDVCLRPSYNVMKSDRWNCFLKFECRARLTRIVTSKLNLPCLPSFWKMMSCDLWNYENVTLQKKCKIS